MAAQPLRIERQLQLERAGRGACGDARARGRPGRRSAELPARRRPRGHGERDGSSSTGSSPSDRVGLAGLSRPRAGRCADRRSRRSSANALGRVIGHGRHRPADVARTSACPRPWRSTAATPTIRQQVHRPRVRSERRRLGPGMYSAVDACIGRSTPPSPQTRDAARGPGDAKRQRPPVGRRRPRRRSTGPKTLVVISAGLVAPVTASLRPARRDPGAWPSAAASANTPHLRAARVDERPRGVLRGAVAGVRDGRSRTRRQLASGPADAGGHERGHRCSRRLRARTSPSNASRRRPRPPTCWASSPSRRIGTARPTASR